MKWSCDVKGDDLPAIRRIARGLEGRIRGVEGVNFVNSSFEWGNPEIRVLLDRDRVSALGLRASDVGDVIETAVEGTRAGRFREGGKEIDIIFKGPRGEMAHTQDLGALMLSNGSGRLVQLSDIAAIRPGDGPTKVEHVDLDRAIKLNANMQDALPLEEAVRVVEESAVAEVRRTLPLGYSIEVSGQAQKLAETWDAFKWTFLLAVVVVHLVMCSLFESWSYPLIIMFSVPLAATGGVLAVSLGHATEPTIKMDTVTMLGFIILTGIVVNNAILIVHQTLNFIRSGEAPQEALLASVRTRIRPIFMTTATTVFGMLSLVGRRLGALPRPGLRRARGVGGVHAVHAGAHAHALFPVAGRAREGPASAGAGGRPRDARGGRARGGRARCRLTPPLRCRELLRLLVPLPVIPAFAGMTIRASSPLPHHSGVWTQLVWCPVNACDNLLVFFAVGGVALPRVVPALGRPQVAPTSYRALPTTKYPAQLIAGICGTPH